MVPQHAASGLSHLCDGHPDASPTALRALGDGGYLLCRVVDTVEDTESIEWDTRRRLFTAFEKALTTGDCTDFEADADAFEDNADGELSRDLRRIIDPMLTFPKPIQAAMRKWIGEMSGGMAPMRDGMLSGSGSTTLHDLSDLERYCYYVAGTVSPSPTSSSSVHLRPKPMHAACVSMRKALDSCSR